ncbi:hypothetical protein Tmar_0065 [Thermaerobacter marianensis DSM 12885]|uniref:DUF6504 domain-containing protein n=1 Tax=Thermaerobacter marianensis (strain ATCC 700841 / DSM 12885 / JCM 10246 / 7p75a) TaxID=644966 RepID=E6SKK3_THEM7|nr:DUF6504 family protein [Thermaerobacter marianensis]ADU50190.1 hypothetical protein Tmar_0065 [Thermaerobacter marianensis DSM 12885]
MGLVDQPVQAWADAQGRPAAFLWRGVRRRVVEILDEWRELGRWWEGDPPEERYVYRVRTEDGGVYEIEYRRPAGRWFLYKVWD